ncbi:unnamed protein product, partial [Ectocarpus fasciculatus]
RRGWVLQATLWQAIPTTTVFPCLPDVCEAFFEKALLGRTAVATCFGRHLRHGDLHAVEQRARRGTVKEVETGSEGWTVMGRGMEMGEATLAPTARRTLKTR